MPSSATSPALPSQLETLVQAFRQANADARRLLTGSRQEQLNRRPAPNSWSALECVVHLNLGNQEMLSAIRQAIAQGRQLPNPANPKYKMDLMGRLLAWSLEPPARMKFKAPAAISEPVAHRSPEETLAQFERLQDELVELLCSAAGLPIDRWKMKSPFANLRYSAYSAFAIIAAHNRRHLWQASKAVDSAAKT